MRLSTLCFCVLFPCFILLKTNASNDVRPRFEGLIGKTVQAAWNRIDQEAPGRPVEIMRESSLQSDKPISRGYVRVIISDKTGRVLYTPILQTN